MKFVSTKYCAFPTENNTLIVKTIIYLTKTFIVQNFRQRYKIISTYRTDPHVSLTCSNTHPRYFIREDTSDPWRYFFSTNCNLSGFLHHIYKKNIFAPLNTTTMKRGKRTCEILKDVRRKVAQENDIPLVERECTHEGDCRGTCP